MDPVRRWASIIALLLSAIACGTLAMQRLEHPRLLGQPSSEHAPGGVFGWIPGEASGPTQFIKCVEVKPDAVVGEPMTYNELARSKGTP
jgi:hypothetical protein